MSKVHTALGKKSLIISIIGFAGWFLVPIFGTLDHIFWDEIISAWIDLAFLIIFAILCLIGTILGYIVYESKEKDKFGLYAYIIAFVWLILNGFWIITGIAALSY